MSKTPELLLAPRLLDAKHAAAYLGISETTLRGLRLPVLKIGRAVRYDVRDLDAFVDRLRGAA